MSQSVTESVGGCVGAWVHSRAGVPGRGGAVLGLVLTYRSPSPPRTSGAYSSTNLKSVTPTSFSTSTAGNVAGLQHKEAK